MQYNIHQFYIANPPIIWIPSQLRLRLTTTNLHHLELSDKLPYIILILLFFLYSSVSGLYYNVITNKMSMCYSYNFIAKIMCFVPGSKTLKGLELHVA